MNYVDIEKRLIDSIHATYDEQIEDSIINIWSVARKVDWLVLMTDYRRNVLSLMNMLGSGDVEVLGRIVSAATLRIPELLEDQLIDLMCESISWRICSKSNSDPANQGLNISPEFVFTDSPDIVIMYMLSNMNLNQLQR